MINIKCLFGIENHLKHKHYVSITCHYQKPISDEFDCISHPYSD